MVKLVKPLQPPKAKLLIAVTPEGMVKLVKPLQPLKAPSPIEVTLEGMFFALHPVNTLDPNFGIFSRYA